MFGFIRPVKSELKVREVERFQIVYCGLCHEIRRRYGRLQTFFLSYDMTFLALVLQAVYAEKAETVQCRCIASPIKKKTVAASSPMLSYTADISVLLTYHKIQDSLHDESGAKRLLARCLERLARRSYQKVCAVQPRLDAIIRQCLDELLVLEQQQSASLDRTADTFARILQAVVPQESTELERRVMEQMFYHTGRWLYLIDACADLEDDFRTGSYNPVRLRFALKTPDLAPVRAHMEHTLERSLLDIHNACQLLTFCQDKGLIENIIDLGLPLITRQVLDGTYHVNGGHQAHGSL
ncbi:MAG: hypothetical protein KHY77_02730 [Butyricicoccus pullicaecorum]|nr:hypothetical protein [Butyricicoccus pullicaecorum]